MPQARKSRPAYELMGVPRERVEADYGQFYAEGGAPNGIREGRDFQRTLESCGFALTPQSSWDRIAYEVRLIQLGMDGLWPEEKGNAELTRDCRGLSRRIDKAARAVADLSRWQSVSLATMAVGTDFSRHISEMFKTARSLEKIAEHLVVQRQPAKWATTKKREARVILACKLRSLFEQEFGVPPKPRGGSDAYEDIGDENDWTKFFQAMAAMVFGEDRTRDRQEILWEADRPSEIPDQ